MEDPPSPTMTQQQRSTANSIQIEVLMQKSLESKQVLLETIKKKILSNSSGVEIQTNPDVPLDSLVGLEDVKKESLAAMRERGGFQRLLLFGVSGSGKAHLVRGLATELQCNLICLNRLKVLFEWEENLEVYTKVLCDICKEEQSSQRQNSILFLNHVDFYAVSSEAHCKALVRFLENVQVIWLKSGLKLAVVGSTFQPQELEGKVVECFNRRVYVPTLNFGERKALLLKQIPKVWKADHLLSEEDASWIARQCFSVVASEIETLITNACQIQTPGGAAGEKEEETGGLEEEMQYIDFRPLNKSDFGRALQQNLIRLEASTFQQFEAFHQTYGNGPFLTMSEREEYNYQEEQASRSRALPKELVLERQNSQDQEITGEKPQGNDSWLWNVVSWFF